MAGCQIQKNKTLKEESILHSEQTMLITWHWKWHSQLRQNPVVTKSRITCNWWGTGGNMWRSDAPNKDPSVLNTSLLLWNLWTGDTACFVKKYKISRLIYVTILKMSALSLLPWIAHWLLPLTYLLASCYQLVFQLPDSVSWYQLVSYFPLESNTDSTSLTQHPGYRHLASDLRLVSSTLFVHLFDLAPWILIIGFWSLPGFLSSSRDVNANCYIDLP